MTVGELKMKLAEIPNDVEVVGSEYDDDYDEYGVKHGAFCVERYYKSIYDDVGVVYVGFRHAHPN